MAQLPNPPTHEKPDILLVSLALQYPVPDKVFELDSFREQSLACARSELELGFFFDALQQRELVRHRPGAEFLITQAGWERAAQLATKSEMSKVAFVAMAYQR